MISKFPNKKLCECRDYVYVLLTLIFYADLLLRQENWRLRPSPMNLGANLGEGAGVRIP